MFGFAGREGGWAGLGWAAFFCWAGLGSAGLWAGGPGWGLGGRGLDLLGLGLGLEVLGPDWGAGAGAGLEGAGYPDVVGLCSTRNPMGLKHLLGGFWELSREGVRFGGFPALLDLYFQQPWYLVYVWSTFAVVDTRFYTKLNGRGGGGGGRPRNWLTPKG